MKWLQGIGLLIAFILIYLGDIFDFVARRGSFGNPLTEISPSDGLTILFWSAVVFVYFFFRFRTWGQPPPPEFAQTPPRHCTTSSRYLCAQLWYAGSMLGVFLVLAFVPQLFDEIYLLLKAAFGGSDPVVSAAFSDPGVLGANSPGPGSFRNLELAQAAPYTAFFLIFVFARFKVLKEPQIRNFFQESALIPITAFKQNKMIRDGDTVFTPDQKVLNHIGDNSLKGLVDIDTYQSDPYLQDIVMAEYVKEQLLDQNDRAFQTAKENSNFVAINNRVANMNATLGKLVDDGAELIRVIEAKELSKLQSWQAQTKGLMQSVVEHSQRVVEVLRRQGESEIALVLDRVTEEMQKLDRLFSKSPRFMETVRKLFAINDDCAIGLELFVDRLEGFTDDTKRLLSTWPVITDDQRSFSRGEDIRFANEELQRLGKVSFELSKNITQQLATKDEETITLNWIHAYQKQLHGDTQRVFNWAFKTRQREVLEQYRELRERMILLMTTLVLASDNSAGDRANRFAKFGFVLDATTAIIPRYMLRITFVVVLLLSLSINFSYLSFGGVYESASQLVFNSSFFSDRILVRDISEKVMLKTPGNAFVWSVIGAFMQMLAIFIALTAWSISPHYHSEGESENRPFWYFTGAWSTGLVFGFFANVLLFFVMGLLFHDTQLLRENWPWTLIGGITGAFLLIQGINVRGEMHSAVVITSIAQGIVSGFAAAIIAWIWGYEQIRSEVLGPFMLFVWLNMSVVGFALGLLAKHFMVNEDLKPQETSSVSSKVKDVAESFTTQHS